MTLPKLSLKPRTSGPQLPAEHARPKSTALTFRRIQTPDCQTANFYLQNTDCSRMHFLMAILRCSMKTYLEIFGYVTDGIMNNLITK